MLNQQDKFPEAIFQYEQALELNPECSHAPKVGHPITRSIQAAIPLLEIPDWYDIVRGERDPALPALCVLTRATT